MWGRLQREVACKFMSDNLARGSARLHCTHTYPLVEGKCGAAIGSVLSWYNSWWRGCVRRAFASVVKRSNTLVEGWLYSLQQPARSIQKAVDALQQKNIKFDKERHQVEKFFLCYFLQPVHSCRSELGSCDRVATTWPNSRTAHLE